MNGKKRSQKKNRLIARRSNGKSGTPGYKQRRQ